MDWTELAYKPEGIRAVYGGEVPDLAEVVLHDVLFHRDGPRVTLGVDLPTFPANPPQKWVFEQHNTVQIKLSFVSVHRVELSGFPRNGHSSMTLTKRSDGIAGEITGADFRLHVESSHVFLQEISAYHSTEPSA